MPKAKVYNMAGEVTGEMELSEAVFGIEPSVPSMHTVVKAHLAARRQGTQSTLTRAEVSGGGAKPWRQKGPGRARQGSTRSPQWTHGGVALGPKPRSYRVSVNKKIRRLALLSALSAKAAAGEVFVIDGLDMPAIKTKDFAAFLQKLGAVKPLVVTGEARENVYKSARNLPGVKTTVAGVLNVYDILNHSEFVVDKAAVAGIEEVYGA
ncbi:MAG: 50S ribosomal protein L4 [Oscillospiraceae bacterium]|nr:50S ribosomal protein L4 [Oscillospiraceae bacterium]